MGVGPRGPGLRPVKVHLPVHSSSLHWLKNVYAAQVMWVIYGEISEHLEAMRSDGEPHVGA